MKKNKRNQFIALAAILLAIGAGLAILNSRQLKPGAAQNENSAPLVKLEKAERSFKVLAVNKDGFKAQDIASKKEENIIVPANVQIENFSGQDIKAGAIIVLKKYIAAANGLVAQEAQVLPPVPTTKPTGELPDKPQ